MTTTSKPKLRIRKPYDATTPVTVTFPTTTMAKQSFKAECDINTIMQKYQATGLITHVRDVQAAYGDFSNVADYQLSLNQVIEAQNAFDNLPSQIRKRFGNQPSALMEFLQDPDNRDEAVKLGLVPAPTPPQPKEPDKARQEASEKPTSTTKEAEPPAA